jgi:hypothetical protein
VKIIGQSDREPVRGDFAAQPEPQGLVVPSDVARSLAGLGVRTAEDLLAYVTTFPSAVAEALHWDVDDVEHARTELVGQLRGLVDESLLTPDPPEHRVLGAFSPDLLRRKA